MYSDKDTCCFCFPLYIAVIIIGCTVILELLEAFVEENILMIILAIALGIMFIVAAIYKNNLCARKTLAYGYATGFVIECILRTLQVLQFFKTDYPF